MKLKAWMNDIEDSRELLSLNIVGTHDCATQFTRLSAVACCQDKSIYDQLNIGVRCLDARVKSKGDRLLMVHGISDIFVKPSHFSKKMDMSDLLNACYKFLDENPSEAIIFQFKNDNNKEMENCFDLLYNTYIKPDADRWYLKNHSPLLSEVRGKLVLLRRCNAYDDRDYSLGTGIDFSGWVEQDELVPETLELKSGDLTFVIQDRYKYNAVDKWSLCVKPFLDKSSDNAFIINYLSTAGGKRIPRKNADFINAKLMKYELKDDKYYGVLYTDFPTDELVSKVIKTNKIV